MEKKLPGIVISYLNSPNPMLVPGSRYRDPIMIGFVIFFTDFLKY